MARPIPASRPDLGAAFGEPRPDGRKPDTRTDDERALEETPIPGTGVRMVDTRLTEGRDEMGEADALQFSEADLGPAAGAHGVEVQALLAANADLQRKVSKLEEALGDATRTSRYWAEKNCELEKLLEEKTDVIRELHARLQDAPHRSPAGNTPREEEVLALSEELERERQQLKEDEEALMKQMSSMEIQMSRERAEMGRQRNELQRLHSEIQHQLELASREASLRDRLQPLARRHQDMLFRKGTEPSPQPASPAAAEAPAPQPPPTRPRESGLFRRLFGQDKG